MNRRQKIIVSVTGIFLVLLLLVGITYAYFLTQVTGNDNDKSISVSTANLAIVYGGDDGSVIGADEVIVPGKTFDAKTFTVTNQGNATTDYVVVVEILDGTSDFESNDFTYTLTCTSGCDGVDTATTFPIDGGILVGNSIDVGETQTYSFTLTYEETGEDQSDDMNKTLNAKLNIMDISSINPYSSNTSLLAYNVINNSVVGANGTTLLSTADTPVAEDIARYKGNVVATESHGFYGWDGLTYGATADEANNSSTEVSGDTDLAKCESVKGQYISDSYNCGDWCDLIGKVTDCESDGTPIIETYIDEYESSVAVAQDDYGVSYYYRGNVEDNYVTFADMCWRIVRIAGDGSIKLILEDQDQACSTSINGNWAIPTTTGGSTYTGNFGYTQYSSGGLTASDGTTTNTSTKYVMDYLHGTTNSDKSMATAFKNFQSTFTTEELAKLKSGDWCFGDTGYDSSNNLLTSAQMLDNKVSGTSFYYDSYMRLTENVTSGFEPTLKCNGTVMNDWDDTDKTPMYVGTITADEIAYAGGKYGKTNQNYYLINDEFKKGSSGANKSYYFWSLSPNHFNGSYDYAFIVSSNGRLYNYYVYDNAVAFRPSVSLASSAVITSGSGTLGDPYVIG